MTIEYKNQLDLMRGNPPAKVLVNGEDRLQRPIFVGDVTAPTPGGMEVKDGYLHFVGEPWLATFPVGTDCCYTAYTQWRHHPYTVHNGLGEERAFPLKSPALDEAIKAFVQTELKLRARAYSTVMDEQQFPSITEFFAWLVYTGQVIPAKEQQGWKELLEFLTFQDRKSLEVHYKGYSLRAEMPDSDGVYWPLYQFKDELLEIIKDREGRGLYIPGTRVLKTTLLHASPGGIVFADDTFKRYRYTFDGQTLKSI
jgi:hypothetical protein